MFILALKGKENMGAYSTEKDGKKTLLSLNISSLNSMYMVSMTSRW